jgi:uDENN domain
MCACVRFVCHYSVSIPGIEDLCFPESTTSLGKVSEGDESRMRCALIEVIESRASPSDVFLFLVTREDRSVLYGVCMIQNEILAEWPDLHADLDLSHFKSSYVSAPRAYCVVSHYPFFDLHLKLIRALIGTPTVCEARCEGRERRQEREKRGDMRQEREERRDRRQE